MRRVGIYERNTNEKSHDIGSFLATEGEIFSTLHNFFYIDNEIE